MTEIYAATTAFIEHKNQRAALTLREGQCFVCIERGHDPIWMDLAPGDYLIDAEDVSDNETGFPVMVAVVAKDHLAAWLDLPTRAIDAMFDAAGDVIAEVKQAEGNDDADSYGTC